MSTKTKIEIEDKSHIKSVTFAFPELMSSDAEENIKKEYKELVDLKNELQQTRVKVWNLERELEEKETAFKNKSNMFTLEFDTDSKEYSTTESDIAFKGLVYHYKK